MIIINNLFEEFGSYGPGIMIILSMYLLWNHHNLFFYYVIGIICDSVLNLILKGIIQQPRPSFDSKELQLALKHNKRFVYKDGIPFDLFGMPSGHASSVLFSTIFVYLALRKTNWLYLYLIMSAFIMAKRVLYNNHTIYQVLVGALTGVCLAFIVYHFAETKLKGRIREKADDNGPI
jgi:membrane-associated phospholipid phosphatase